MSAVAALPRTHAKSRPSGRVLLTKAEVAARLNCHPITVWRRMHADTKFPRPIEVSPNRIAWYEHELDAYIKKRPRRKYA